MSERTEVQAAFALRLVADLLTALAITDVISIERAIAVVDDVSARAAADDPDRARLVRQIGKELERNLKGVQERLRRALENDQGE